MRNETNLTGKILLLLIGVIILILLLMRKGDQEESREEAPVQEQTELPEESADRYEFAIGQTIRVLLKTTDFKGIYHENVILSSDTAVNVTIGDLKKTIPAGSELSMSSLFSAYGELTGQEGESVTVPNQAVFTTDTADGQIKVLTLGRHQGTPAYRGSLEIRKTNAGYLIINELPIEEYLYSVVTSEMPSDYPSEALKAQAVCARSYAVRQMLDPAYKEYEADVDDSSGYQVYNNVKESGEAIAAVKETNGRVVIYQGGIASTYYFSTSCGQTTNDEVWRNEDGNVEEQKPYLTAQHIGPKEEAIAAVKLIDEGQDFSPDLTTEEGFASYILSSDETDYEKAEPWYRWSMSFYPSQLIYLKDRIAERFAINKNLILIKDGDHFVPGLPEKYSDLSDIQILHRNEGGLIDEILLCFGEEEIKILTEYNIRYILAAEGAVITKNDKEMTDCGSLLPSAYFTMELKRNESNDILEEIVLNGGGFGHGVGMSQNGAKNMALSGMNYQDILSFFYDGTTIGAVYE